MEQSLVMTEAPALDPAWIEHEKDVGLNGPAPKFSKYEDRQFFYSQACKRRNDQMLAGRDKDLTHGIIIADSTINASDGHPIRIRFYTPTLASKAFDTEGFVIYYHGGGLKVGDLDSEDLSCRRICKEAQIKIASVEYRLMPQNPPQKALGDAYEAFLGLTSERPSSERVILVGSSSGGQVAAQVAQLARDSQEVPRGAIDGLLLRCPVTVDASDGGIHIPERFREMHTSFAPSFESSLLTIDTDTARQNTPNLPLEAASFHNLPRTFIQLCSNDLYYSDGICYAAALRDAGIEVKIDVVRGWPHTFWLKAPQLDRALEADMDMVKGLRWLLDIKYSGAK
jgi:acetyl esterase/lipase